MCTVPDTVTSAAWVQRVGTWVGIPGGYWEGYTGYYPATQHGARGGSQTSEAGPEALQGLEWWV